MYPYYYLSMCSYIKIISSYCQVSKSLFKSFPKNACGITLLVGARGLGFSRSGVCCQPMPTPIGEPVQTIKQRLATSAARAATAFRSEGPEPGKDSRPSVSRGNVPSLKWLKRLIAKDADEKPFLVSLLSFRVSRSGHFKRSFGRGKAPPPCSRLRCASRGQGLPPP